MHRPDLLLSCGVCFALFLKDALKLTFWYFGVQPIPFSHVSSWQASRCMPPVGGVLIIDSHLTWIHSPRAAYLLSPLLEDSSQRGVIMQKDSPYSNRSHLLLGVFHTKHKLSTLSAKTELVGSKIPPAYLSADSIEYYRCKLQQLGS